MATHTSEADTGDREGLERLNFFSDAVFAVAITLLALDIRLPAAGHLTEVQLQAALLEIAPRYLGYVVSFVTVGLFWLGHHRKFRFIKRYDAVLLRLNLLQLMVVAFVPFYAQCGTSTWPWPRGFLSFRLPRASPAACPPKSAIRRTKTDRHIGADQQNPWRISV